MAPRIAALVGLLASAAAQEQPPLLPPWPPSYAMNASTIVMSCNYTGYMTGEAPEGRFSIIDFDWSNALSLWSNR
jgi:hypothetical protein